MLASPPPTGLIFDQSTATFSL